MNNSIENNELIFECGCKFKILDNNIKASDGLPSVDIDYYNIPLECSETWETFKSSTKGVFQLETPLGNSYSRKLKPENIEHLSALISILRPGVLKAKFNDKSVTQHYIDRKNGLEECIPEHPLIAEIVKDTYGLNIYQEITLKIAQKLAGFGLKEADVLRKAIGKKIPSLMTEVENKFIEGCKKVGLVNEDEAKSIWDNIRKSERYSFNKSHAVAYGIIGYVTAYVKTHFPLQFYTSWLSFAKHKIGAKQEIKNLIRDARQNKVKVNNPSILHLHSDFTIHEKEIWFGLSNIKGLGEAQFNKLKIKVKELEQKLGKQIRLFSEVELLVNLFPELSKTIVTNLILVGGFSHLNCDRRRLLYYYTITNQLTNRELIQLTISKQNSLIDKFRDIKASKPRQKIIDGLISSLENPSSSLNDNDVWINKTEEDLLGIPLSVSKLDTSEALDADTTCKEFLDGKDGSSAIAVEIVTSKEITTKKEEKMGFLSVEDETALLDNLVVFSKVWDDYKSILYEGNVCILSGYKSSKGSFVVQKAIQI